MTGRWSLGMGESEQKVTCGMPRVGMLQGVSVISYFAALYNIVTCPVTF